MLTLCTKQKDNTTNTITVEGLGFENPETAATFSVYTKNTGNVPYTFDYTGNNTREDGLTNENADITLVALGLDNAQYVTATGEIGNGAGQNFSITAPLERNYNDPL